MRKLLSTALIVVTVLAAGCGVAHADSLAFAGSSSGAFGTMDLNNGAFTSLGNSGQTLAGLAVANGSIFASSYHASNGSLFQVNPATGTLTTIGTAAGVTYDDFGSTTTGLYAVSYGSTQDLYSINPTTGAATLIGPTGLGYGAWRGLSDNGTGLYFSDGADLYTLSTTTGAATLVGAFGGSSQMGALLFEDGTLWGGDDVNGTIDAINLGTGAATVGPHPSGTFQGSFYGLAPSPIPGTIPVSTTPEPATLSLFSLGTGALVLLRRRTR